MRITSIFNFFWQIIILFIMLSFLAASAYHLVLGPNSIEAREEIRQNIEISEKELQTVQAEYDRLYHKISLLSSDIPDMDLLEERVREVLDYGKENEAILRYNP
ncbi:MAG: FtsB family cell division protein [Alphaproteobacteria bacterium]